MFDPLDPHGRRELTGYPLTSICMCWLTHTKVQFFLNVIKYLDLKDPSPEVIVYRSLLISELTKVMLSCPNLCLVLMLCLPGHFSPYLNNHRLLGSVLRLSMTLTMVQMH